MSNTFADNLSREKIQQLLDAIGSRPSEDTSQIESTEYNWHQPRYFSSEQLRSLDEFMKKVSTSVAGKFTSLCQCNFDVTIDSFTQHFASEFINQSLDNEQSDYYLTFGTNQNHLCGVISIPLKTAVIWTTQLLGDLESGEDTDKELTQLEISLLSDIASGIVEAFSDSFETVDFHPAGNITKGQWPLRLQDTKELCKIIFSVKKAESENASVANLLILCSELEPVVGKDKHTAHGLSAEDISKAIIERVQQVRVCVTAELSTTYLSFHQILNLQTDDILILDKRIDEPMDLVVDGRTVNYGWPAKSAGQYAVVITASEGNSL